MDEALELGQFLPFSVAAENEAEYLRFLWEAFESNYGQGRYEFASLAYHLLYMSFISFSIWQIRIARQSQFELAMVGFQNDTEAALLSCDNPFKFYERLKESQIFRFMKLIGCGNEQVGEFAKFVRRRNRIAHPTGSVFFNDREAIDDELALMMREVRNIQGHMEPVIAELYDRFLMESADAGELAYATLHDEISANLIHKNYMSLADLKICAEANLDQIHPHAALIADLHAEVRSLVTSEAALA
jgi:hypothetical protein